MRRSRRSPWRWCIPWHARSGDVAEAMTSAQPMAAPQPMASRQPMAASRAMKSPQAMRSPQPMASVQPIALLRLTHCIAASREAARHRRWSRFNP